MQILSLFSGAGGLDLGLEQAGHRVVGMCEIDPKAREVLAHHWPDTPIHDDVTTLNGADWHGRVDIVSGGSPCQDLSVAGRRQGLDGSRSGLFWHQCRIADQAAARWVLWENVAGALSSNNGADFAAVLWGLTGTLPDVPDEGWRSCGVVVGPKRWAVWRLLDARWFGVPQRRRRVFVVAGAGGAPRPEILFESACCPRDSGPGAASQQEVAGTLGGGTPGVGPRTDTDRMTFVPCRDVTATLRASSMNIDDNTAQDGHLIPMVSGPITARTAKGPNTTVDEAALIPTELGTVTAVRRLTPLECERLMGWPDHWTAEGINGLIADSHRYRMCGNGVVTPVAKWIGQKLAETEQ